MYRRRIIYLCGIITILILVLIPALPALAQEETPDPVAEPQTCGECHLDYHVEWQTGAHATAYDVQSFQEAWVSEGRDPDCLSCHTTGFQPATGDYLMENIQCEACHGVTPADHPPATFEVSTGAEICGDCHTGTFDEWERSLHAFSPDMGAIGCATCHNPHGQTLRFETVNATCTNCHNEEAEDLPPYASSYVHVTHQDAMVDGEDMTCSACHMNEMQRDDLHMIADHSMVVSTTPCNTCHESMANMVAFSPDDTVDMPDAEVTPAVEPESDSAEAATVEDDTETHDTEEETDFVELTQGLILGLGLGLTLLLISRLRS